MLRRYIIVINFVFIILGLFLGNRIYAVWNPGEDPREGLSTAQKGQTTFSLPALIPPKKPPRKTCQVIMDKDLFRPERTEWRPQTQSTQKVKTARTELNITVYGIVISDDLKFAWIKLEGKKQKVKKVSEGESIKGWTVSRIDPEYVELTGGGETVKHNLIKKGEPKPRTAPKSRVTKKPRKKSSKPSQPRKTTRNKK